MVCRTKTANSALITCAQQEHDVTDVQAIGLFHALQREGKDAPAPTREQYEAFLRENLAVVGDVSHTPGLSDARRASIALRLQSALEADDTPDGRTWHALNQIQDRAGAAAQAQQRFLRQTAERTGRSEEDLTRSFQDCMEKGIPDGVVRQAIPVRGDDFPVDRRSLYAAHIIEAENGLAVPMSVLRCDTCGQFRGDGHMCPEAGAWSRHEPARFARPRRYVIDLDNTVADFNGAMEQLVAKTADCDIDEICEPCDYHASCRENYSIPAMIKKFNDLEMYEDLQAYPGAVSSVERLIAGGNQVTFVTARHAKNGDSTARWVRRYFGEVPIVHSRDKLSVDADVYIDDAPENIKAARAAGKRVYALGFHYNAGSDALPLDWDSFIDAEEAVADTVEASA